MALAWGIGTLDGLPYGYNFEWKISANLLISQAFSDNPMTKYVKSKFHNVTENYLAVL
jgi:hypothetical protein